MKLKIILILVFFAITSTIGYCANEQVKIFKCINGYWKNVFSENPGNAIKQFSVQTYFNLVFGKEYSNLSRKDKKNFLINGTRMYKFNLKNLAKLLKHQGFSGKININKLKIDGISAMISGSLKSIKKYKPFRFKQYLRKIKEKWFICDVSLNNKRDSRLMAELTSKIGIDTFSSLLKTYFKNETYIEKKLNGISIKFPKSYDTVHVNQIQDSDFGQLLTTVARENTCITVSRKANCGFADLQAASDKLKENLKNSGASFIAESFDRSPESFSIKVFTHNKSMPTGYAFLTINQRIKGNTLYTIIFISPDLWGMQLISYQAEKILDSIKLK